MMQADDKFADNNFTPLRLGLALLVVLGHYKLFIGIGSPTFPFNYAALAVECFFVVSGYLVANSFDRDPDLKRFFIKRFFRIYPLYITVVIAQTLILGSLAEGGITANLGSMGTYLLANAAFANFLQYDVGSAPLSGLYESSLNASLWTLKIEFAFYLLLPFIWRLFMRYGVVVLVGIFLASVAYQQGMELAGHHTLAKQLPGQLQFFVLGVAAYRYRHLLRLENRWVGLGLAMALAAVVTALLTTRPPVLYPLLVAALVVALSLLTPRVKMKSDISYGVYLLHAPIIQLSLLFGIYEPGLDGLAVTVALVLLLALAAERWVEAPGIALGRRLIRRTRSPAPTPPDGPGELTVVMLNDYCHVQGGASKVAIDEAVRLSSSGVKVIFVGAVGPVCDALRDAPVEVHCLGQRELLDAGRHPATVMQGLWNGKAARRVAAILEKLSPAHTIVHLHGYTKALTTAPVRAAERLGVPVICTLHDFFPACPNGAFFNYQTAQPCARRALSRDCITTRCDKRRHAHKLFRVARGMIQRVLGRFPASVAHYIALSERSVSILSPYLPRQARIHRLPNPVEAPAQSVPAPVALNDMILYLGRLDEEKGVRLLARVAATMGLPVTFVGDGPLRAEIEAIPGMRVTGWLDRADIQSYLSRARCLVFPSLWYETFGLTVSEAAARGVPAIVSDITAAAERVEDGVTGWCFRSGDADDLARCLDLILDDARVQAAGTAAYHAFWADSRSGDRHIVDLLKIYRAAVARDALA